MGMEMSSIKIVGSKNFANITSIDKFAELYSEGRIRGIPRDSIVIDNGDTRMAQLKIGSRVVNVLLQHKAGQLQERGKRSHDDDEDGYAANGPHTQHEHAVTPATDDGGEQHDESDEGETSTKTAQRCHGDGGDGGMAPAKRHRKAKERTANDDDEEQEHLSPSRRQRQDTTEMQILSELQFLRTETAQIHQLLLFLASLHPQQQLLQQQPSSFGAGPLFGIQNAQAAMPAPQLLSSTALASTVAISAPSFASSPTQHLQLSGGVRFPSGFPFADSSRSSSPFLSLTVFDQATAGLNRLRSAVENGDSPELVNVSHEDQNASVKVDESILPSLAGLEPFLPPPTPTLSSIIHLQTATPHHSIA